MVGAREFLAETVLSPNRAFFDDGDERSVGELERSLDALGDALASAFVEQNAIDHRVDVVDLVAAETKRILTAVLEHLAEIDDLAIRARAHQPLLLQPLEHLAVVTLLGTHDRRAKHRALASEARKQRVNDLARIGRADRLAAHMR